MANGQYQNSRAAALADYAEVHERIQMFYDKYPTGAINTELVSWVEGKVMVKAYAYRNLEDTKPCGTGMAYEMEGSSQVNRTSALENCETSAVGRALAMAGIAVKKSVASREEVANAIHQQDQPDVMPQAPRMATKQQYQTIGRIVTEIGKSKEEVAEIAAGLEIKDARNMTSEQAIKLISTLESYRTKETA